MGLSSPRDWVRKNAIHLTGCVQNSIHSYATTPAMEVKVQCPCGTRYKFDVELINGQLPGPVSCPTCGADGTAASNAIIQQSLSAPGPALNTGGGQAAPADKPRIRLHVPSPAAAPSTPAATPVAQPVLAQPAPRLAAAGGVSLANATAAEPPPARPVPALALPVAQPARTKGSFGLGIVGAVVGTLLSVALWLGIFYATELGSRSIIKLFAIGVGFMAGLGARLLGRDEGSKELGSITAAIAFLGIFGAQYLIAKEQIVGSYKKVVGQVYEARVDYAKKAVKAIPTGSDQEIREFLAKESAEDGEIGSSGVTKRSSARCMKRASITPKRRSRRFPPGRIRKSASFSPRNLPRTVRSDRRELQKGRRPGV